MLIVHVLNNYPHIKMRACILKTRDIPENTIHKSINNLKIAFYGKQKKNFPPARSEWGTKCLLPANLHYQILTSGDTA